MHCIVNIVTLWERYFMCAIIMMWLLMSKLSDIRFCCFCGKQRRTVDKNCSYFNVTRTHTELVLLWMAATCKLVFTITCTRLSRLGLVVALVALLVSLYECTVPYMADQRGLAQDLHTLPVEGLIPGRSATPAVKVTLCCQYYGKGYTMWPCVTDWRGHWWTLFVCQRN